MKENPIRAMGALPEAGTVTALPSEADGPCAALPDLLAETFPPGARKPRHDGFTPAAIGAFLRELAAHGIVEHAARAAGVSGSAAYAFRNRPSGRAFARMWDAVLIHRARARLAAENQQAATLGCVSRRFGPDGELIGTYHYRDNRLAMAMLSRLDRLAGSEAADDGHLRSLSEDLDAFIACAEEGGDLDAFVEERRPEPEPEAVRAAAASDRDGAPGGKAAPACTVWEEDDGGLLTDLPPPAGFAREAFGAPGPYYQRELSAEEEEAWESRRDDPDFAIPMANPDAIYAGVWRLVQGTFFPEAASARRSRVTR